ncbi:MAG: hypothetical protein V1899_03510 [Planctomycetota bacterium]
MKNGRIDESEKSDAWKEIEPYFDEALEKLPRDKRNALILEKQVV